MKLVSKEYQLAAEFSYQSVFTLPLIITMCMYPMISITINSFYDLLINIINNRSITE